MVERNVIEIVRAASDVMIADSLTKPTNIKKFEWCREQMGINRMAGGIASRGSVETQSDTKVPNDHPPHEHSNVKA